MKTGTNHPAQPAPYRTARTPADAILPLLPEERLRAELEDTAHALATEGARLAGAVPAAVLDAVGDLVRSMNCYYSNLIEGHDTLPRDIARAMRDDLEPAGRRRDLQLEARAHIEVQGLIDTGAAPRPAIGEDFAKWAHEAFYSHVPDDLCVVALGDGRTERVRPGAFRADHQDVDVGRHEAPEAAALVPLMRSLEEAYGRLSSQQRVIAVAATHHRFLWVHPFIDGNGRVARLMSHAAFAELGIGSPLWSVSRGLARTRRDYKAALQAADAPRQGDLDGRGPLSQGALVAFCRYFLDQALDQVRFMAELMHLERLRTRYERHVRRAVEDGTLPEGSWEAMRLVLFEGETGRSAAAAETGWQERKARSVISHLLDLGYLTSSSPKGPLRLGFPIDALEDVLPRLYPADRL